MNTPSDVQEHLPLTEVTFFIMLSMARQPRHGYAILKDVADLSDGRIHLSAGTLYGALGRLLEQDWIARLEDDQSDETGRPRKEYELTDLGHRVLSAEVRRLETLATLARLHTVRE